MRITDQAVIDNIVKTADEANDGFFAFCCQGHRAIEMLRYSAKTKRLNGAKGFYNATMYQIIVYVTIDNESLDLTELSQFCGDLEKEYKIESSEFYGEERTAYARLMSLIAEHNHF